MYTLEQVVTLKHVISAVKSRFTVRGSSAPRSALWHGQPHTLRQVVTWLDESGAGTSALSSLHGHLAHKKTPPPSGLPKGPRHMPTEGS